MRARARRNVGACVQRDHRQFFIDVPDRVSTLYEFFIPCDENACLKPGDTADSVGLSSFPSVRSIQ